MDALHQDSAQHLSPECPKDSVICPTEHSDADTLSSCTSSKPTTGVPSKASQGLCSNRFRCPTGVYPGSPPGPCPLKENVFSSKSVSRYPGHPPSGICPTRQRVTPSVIPPAQKATLPAASSNGRRPPSSRPPPPPLLRRTVGSTPRLPTFPDLPQPPKGRIPRRLQWQNVNDARALGSIWETLIVEEASLTPRQPRLPTYIPVNPSLLSHMSPVARSCTFRETPSEDLQSDAPQCAVTPALSLDYHKLNCLFFDDPGRRRKSGEGCSSEAQLLNGLTDSQKGSQDAGGLTRRTCVTVLDPKRRQNVEICLKGLGLLDEMTPLLNTVVNLVPFQKASETHVQEDIRCLSPESLQMVVSLYPTKDEEKGLRDAALRLESNDSVTLGKAEMFLLRLLQIDGFRARAECCLIRLTLFEELRSVSTTLFQLNTVVSRVTETLQRGALRSILGFILRAGNYLNYGSRKGQARGFSLECLSQLKSVKSVDNSTTLLRLVADAVEAQCPCAWDELRRSIGSYTTVSTSWMDDTVDTLKQMDKKLEKIDKEVAAMQHDTVFVAVFTTFRQSAGEQVDTAQQQLKDAEAKLLRLTELCAEREKTTKIGLELLKQLNGFWKDLRTAHMDNQEAEKRLRGQLVRDARRRGRIASVSVNEEKVINEKLVNTESASTDILQESVSSSDTGQLQGGDSSSSFEGHSIDSSRIFSPENGSEQADATALEALFPNATETAYCPFKETVRIASFEEDSQTSSHPIKTAVVPQRIYPPQTIILPTVNAPTDNIRTGPNKPLEKTDRYSRLEAQTNTAGEEHLMAVVNATKPPCRAHHATRLATKLCFPVTRDSSRETPRPAKSHPKVPKLMMDRLLGSYKAKGRDEDSTSRKLSVFREPHTAKTRMATDRLLESDALQRHVHTTRPPMSAHILTEPPQRHITDSLTSWVPEYPVKKEAANDVNAHPTKKQENRAPLLPLKSISRTPRWPGSTTPRIGKEGTPFSAVPSAPTGATTKPSFGITATSRHHSTVLDGTYAVASSTTATLDHSRPLLPLLGDTSPPVFGKPRQSCFHEKFYHKDKGVSQGMAYKSIDATSSLCGAVTAPGLCANNRVRMRMTPLQNTSSAATNVLQRKSPETSLSPFMNRVMGLSPAGSTPSNVLEKASLVAPKHVYHIPKAYTK